MLPHTVRALLGFLALIAAAPSAIGHAMDTNLYVQLHLHEDKLVCEVDVGSFQFPPLQEVEFARPDTHPTLEEKREELEQFFREKCPVTIDGLEVQPVLTSLKLEDFEAADHLMRAMDIVYVGLKYEYSLKRVPKKIAMKWGFFAQPHEEDGGTFPGTPDDPAAIADGLAHDPQEVVADFIIHGDRDEYDLVYFSPTEPEYIWHRPAEKQSEQQLTAITSVRGAQGEVSGRGVRTGLFSIGGVLALLGTIAVARKRTSAVKLAVVFALGSMACFAGGFLQHGSSAGPLSNREAIETFKALHANIYSAFDHNTEDEIYDALAQSVDGPLLNHVYNDVFESLILRSEGGVMAKVQKVETLNTEVVAIPDDSSSSYVIDCAWRVHGFVKHYSHTHRRLNEYNATYEMAPREGKWKIIKSVETKRERLDGQVQSDSAGGVLPPPGSDDVGGIIPDEVPENLDLPGILDGNTME